MTRGHDRLSLPENVNTAVVDYNDLESLQKAFTGQDAVVAVTPGQFAEVQFKPIEAAIKAGVYRFIPSEYGVDITNPLARKMPITKTKQEIEKRLVDAAKAGQLTYSSIYGGSFVEWALSFEELISVKQRKAKIQNGGNIPFTLTRMDDYARAVVGVLSNPSQTENQSIFVQSCRPTQNQLLGWAQELLPGEWKVEYVDTDKNAATAAQKMAEGFFDLSVVEPMVMKIMFTPEYGGQLDGVHNALVGVQEMTEMQLREMIMSSSR